MQRRIHARPKPAQPGPASTVGRGCNRPIRRISARRRKGIVRILPGTPGVVAARVKMERHGRAIKLGFDFVLNIRRRDDEPAKIAGLTASLATPHAQRGRTSQTGDIQASGSGFRNRRSIIGGYRPRLHLLCLRPKDPPPYPDRITMPPGYYKGKHCAAAHSSPGI